MRSRDQLFGVLILLHGWHPDQANELIDNFAHELAEKQRAHANTLESYSGLYDGDHLHSLPDLIDPQVQSTTSKENQA